jgi:hypothetical protein
LKNGAPGPALDQRRGLKSHEKQSDEAGALRARERVCPRHERSLSRLLQKNHRETIIFD